MNAFLYSHGARTWTARPTDIPDKEPGTLLVNHIEVLPPGNNVRSYLDIVAPDETPWGEVRIALMDFVGQCQPQPLPWVAQSGRCWFRLNMELGLAHQWHQELSLLYREAQSLRLANPV